MVVPSQKDRGADLKFEFEFKKKPQSLETPRSCVGLEPGDALKGHRVDSVVLLQRDCGLGRKTTTEPQIQCSVREEQGTFSMTQNGLP